MIASVQGTVGAITADSLVIEVGGIGYRVYVAPAVIATAAGGGKLRLHTYHLVREDQQALFGFRNAEELGFFNLLLTVTGVGPKVALAIVGSRPTADLQLAILQLAEVPTPDDTADALATAICLANAERPGDRVNTAAGGKAAVMDRSAVAPIARGETPYERSVREAIAREAKVAAGRP